MHKVNLKDIPEQEKKSPNGKFNRFMKNMSHVNNVTFAFRSVKSWRTAKTGRFFSAPMTARN